MLQNLAELYGYKIIERESYVVFEQIARDNDDEVLHIEMGSTENHELLVSNAPINICEEKLFPLFLKFGNFTSLKVPSRKLMKHPNFYVLFLKYDNENIADKSNDFLDKFEISNGAKLRCEKCFRNTIVYLENLKLAKFPFYKIQQFFLTNLFGLKSITFASPNNYGRYAIRLEFCDYYAANLGKKIIEQNIMFSKSTEVNVDWYQRIGPRTEPAIKFEWKNKDVNEIPTIVLLSEKSVRAFQSS